MFVLTKRSGMKRGAEQMISDVQSRVTDLMCVLFLVLLVSLAMLLPTRIDGAHDVLARLGLVMSAYGVLSWIYHLLPRGEIRAILRISILAALLMYVFDEMQYFQRILFDRWLDEELLAVEYSLFGTNMAVATQEFANPVVTEGLMFAYTVYMPLLPLIAYLLYRTGGEAALNEYLLNLSLIFIVCYCGYILLPVASPMYHAPRQFTVPLRGGFFTWCADWLRHNQHYPGGSVPSAHTAAATGILIMLYRHKRSAFYIILPTILLLYVATVYGRFHYVSDAVIGIAVGILVPRLSPALVRMVTGAVAAGRRPAVPHDLAALKLQSGVKDLHLFDI